MDINKQNSWAEKENISLKKNSLMQRENEIEDITKEIKKKLIRVRGNDIDKIIQNIPHDGGIYKILNKKNGKFYIGSSKNLNNRLYRGHFLELENNIHCNSHLQYAWNKDKKKSFIFEIIELIKLCDIPKHYKISEFLQYREQYYLDTLLFAQEYIKKENRKFLELGYNLCPNASNQTGVMRVPVLRYDLCGNFIDEWPGVNYAQEKLNIGSISQACVKNINTAGGYIWRYKGTDKIELKIDLSEYNLKDCSPKSFLQYDLYGNFIKEWKSANEANITLKINGVGRRNYSGEFIWIRKIDNEIKHKIDISLYRIKPKKEILQYDLDGNFIKKWESLDSINKYYNTKAIKHTLNRKQKSSCNFLWIYKETDNIKFKIDGIKNIEKNIGRKKILQYDLEGNFIKEWESITEARRKLKIISISAACMGDYKTSGGFIWRYKINDKIELKIVKPDFETGKENIRSKIIQLSLDNNFIRNWNSIKEAEETLNICSISAVCRGKQKSAGGFKWEYIK